MPPIRQGAHVLFKGRFSELLFELSAPLFAKGNRRGVLHADIIPRPQAVAC
jgi:hypothetical protein